MGINNYYIFKLYNNMLNVLSYFFFSLLCISSLCIILMQNTFFALLFLILSFFFTAIILLIFELEFLGLIFLVIYVGAVAVLLLFVLMMLETKLKNFYTNIFLYFPLGSFINAIFFFEMLYTISNSFNTNCYYNCFTFNHYLNWYNILDTLTDLETYGQFLYIHCVLHVLIVGLILFLALIGIIFLLTKPMDRIFKSQTSFCQLSRSYPIQSYIHMSVIVCEKCTDYNPSLAIPIPYVSVDGFKVQESLFLPEYFFITSFFCLILFSLFSLKPMLNQKYFFIKFQYNNQLIFLLVLIIICYLILVYQQINLSLLTNLSFNDSIINDLFSIAAKFIIGVSSLCFLIFISHYVKEQRLSSLEYYIILFTSIFGFLLLCCSNNFLTAYLAIELQGLAFYLLAAFKKSSNFSIESGVKYFIIGSLSTVFFLFGVTFVYGFSGSLILTDYNDFFVWILSKSGSLFFFEAMVKASHITNCSILKLQIIFDSFKLIKNKFNFCALDFDVLNSVSRSDSLRETLLFYDIFMEIFSRFYKLDTISFRNDQIKLNCMRTTIEFYLENIFNERVFLIKLLKFFKTDFDLLLNIIANQNNVFLYELLNSNDLSCAKLINNSFIYSILLDEVISQRFNKFVELYNTVTFFFMFNMDVRTNRHSFNLADFIVKLDNINIAERLFVLDFSLVTLGILIIFLALIFKLALAPFHLWSPDVYEGSPSSSTFFFMVISKLSVFIFLLRICYSSFYSFISYWQVYSLIIASISIFVGAIVGLKQRKLKSLLTYSSINNMGFVMLAFSTGSFEGVHAQFYYLIIYTITSLCFWAIILNLKLKKSKYIEKQNKDIGDLALLQESNSITAQNIAIILFSMAGLPPMVGFLVKIGVFKALVGVSIHFFSIINILFSVVATFYYLRIVKVVFFENILIGSLYSSLNSKKVFLINFLCFLLIFLFIAPMFLYLYLYKITLFLNKSFY